MKFNSLQSQSFLLLVLILLTSAVQAWGQDVTYYLTKVTSVEKGGLYVFEQDGYVMTNTVSSSALQCTNDYKTTGLTGTEAYVWQLMSGTDGYKMKNVSKGTNGYLTNSSSTTVSLGNSGSVWAFNFQADETVLIQNISNGNRFLGFTNNTSHAYKAYATSNLATYPHAVVVYQLVEGQPTPVPEHTATFSINGTTSTTDVKEGGAITFPDVTAPDDFFFMGWTTTAIEGTTDTAPAWVNEATMGTADVTFFAVFAQKTSSGAATLTDVLTPEAIGQKTYGDWTGKAFTSSAVYAGNSTTSDNNEIQMRSNNSNSGIVTTISGGKVTKVAIEWASTITTERTLDIYGKNTPYTAATDLYSTNKQGTLIGSIVITGDTKEVAIAGDYAYIGMRSNTGALYLEQIAIDWFTESSFSYTDYCTTIPQVYVLDEHGGNAALVTELSGQTVNVKVERTLSPDYYNTLFLPFAMDETQMAAAFGDGAQVAKYDGLASNGTTFIFKNVETMDAGVAYLVKPTKVVNGFTVKKVTVVDPETHWSMNTGDYTMEGTVDAYTYTGETGTPVAVYYFTNGGKVKKLAKGGEIPGLHAFMSATATITDGDDWGRAREEFNISIDGEMTTGISQLTIDNSQLTIKAGAWYTLDGRRLSGKPTRKGIYIVNGKKVVR